MEYEAWAEKAACTSADPNIFFPEGKGSGASRAAKQICSTCEVLLECREYAVLNDVQGVWGGWSELQIRKERTKRGTSRQGGNRDPSYPNGIEKTA